MRGEGLPPDLLLEVEDEDEEEDPTLRCPRMGGDKSDEVGRGAERAIKSGGDKAPEEGILPARRDAGADPGAAWKDCLGELRMVLPAAGATRPLLPPTRLLLPEGEAAAWEVAAAAAREAALRAASGEENLSGVPPEEEEDMEKDLLLAGDSAAGEEAPRMGDTFPMVWERAGEGMTRLPGRWVEARPEIPM